MAPIGLSGQVLDAISCKSSTEAPPPPLLSKKTHRLHSCLNIRQNREHLTQGIFSKYLILKMFSAKPKGTDLALLTGVQTSYLRDGPAVKKGGN